MKSVGGPSPISVPCSRTKDSSHCTRFCRFAIYLDNIELPFHMKVHRDDSRAADFLLSIIDAGLIRFPA